MLIASLLIFLWQWKTCHASDHKYQQCSQWRLWGIIYFQFMNTSDLAKMKGSSFFSTYHILHTCKIVVKISSENWTINKLIVQYYTKLIVITEHKLQILSCEWTKIKDQPSPYKLEDHDLGCNTLCSHRILQNFQDKPSLQFSGWSRPNIILSQLRMPHNQCLHCWGMQLTIHLHLVIKLKKCGAISPSPHMCLVKHQRKI